MADSIAWDKISNLNKQLMRSDDVVRFMENPPADTVITDNIPHQPKMNQATLIRRGPRPSTVERVCPLGTELELNHF